MDLETVEILLEVEDHFGIRVPDELASTLVTVEDLQRVIVDQLVQTGHQPSAQLQADVLRELVRISAEITGDDPATIRPDSRWVGDVTPYG